MRCSQRALDLEASATLALAARVKALRAEGKDVLGFSAGEPDLAPPAAAVAAVRQAIEDGKNGYEPVPGTPEAREAIAAFHRKGGVDCTADDIVLTAGGKMALFLVLQALLEPGRGDEVVILTPAWVSYKPMIELCGGKVVEVPCTFEDGFRPDPEAVAAAMTPNTAAVMLNSPGNPTGEAFVHVHPPGAFTNVTSLAFFFPGNHGEGDETSLQYIGMQGDHSHDRREAVDATYELVCQHSSVDVAAETQGTMGV